MYLKKVFDFIKFIYDFCKVKTVFDSVMSIYTVYMANWNFTFHRIHNAMFELCHFRKLIIYVLSFVPFKNDVDREVLMTYMAFRRRWLNEHCFIIFITHAVQHNCSHTQLKICEYILPSRVLLVFNLAFNV